MKTHTHSKTTYTIPGTDLEVELRYDPSPIMQYKDPIVQVHEDRIVLGYLAHDEDCSSPLEDDDYIGCIYEARRHGKTLRDYEKALALGDFEGEDRNPHAVLLDVYEHSGVSYSVAGHGMQCQFDTARGGAVWVPSEALLSDLTGPDAQTRALELARQACETYTDWCNGNCYGVVVLTFDLEGVLLEDDACWGYIGDDYAYASLKTDFKQKELQ